MQALDNVFEFLLNTQGGEQIEHEEVYFYFDMLNCCQQSHSIQVNPIQVGVWPYGPADFDFEF